MPIEIPFLLKILAGIQSLWEFASKEVDNSREKKRKFFDDYVEYSYKKLFKIHKDYTDKFIRAIGLMEENKELQDVVKILKEERLCYLLDRQEISEVLNGFVEQRMARTKKNELFLLFYDYVAAVVGYLHAASPLPATSWYTYFIEQFSDLVERGQDPMQEDYACCAEGSKAPILAIEQLKIAVHQDMPEAFKKIQSRYGKLRAKCLC